MTQDKNARSVDAVAPAVAAQWHVVYNGKLSAAQVSARSWKTVWWKDEDCGHEWQARVRSRTGRRDKGCPFHGRKAEVHTPHSEHVTRQGVRLEGMGGGF